MKTVGLICALALAATSAFAQKGNLDLGADPKLHGAYPTNYQEIITNWLQTVLVDPASAQIEWISGPKPGTLPEKKHGDPLFGYLVELKINSRNRFGAYTGMQKHTILIKDGQVIKTTGFGFGF